MKTLSTLKTAAIQNVTTSTAVKSLLGVSLLVTATTVAAHIRIPLPFTPVPITFQDFTVLLGAALLGRYRGAIAQSIYLVLGSFGLPLFAGAAVLTPYLLGPTGGYLIGFVAAAFFVGLIMSRKDDYKLPAIIGIFAAAQMLIFIPGIVQLATWLQTDFSKALWLGFVPFIPGAILKVSAASLIYSRLQTSARKLLN